MMDEIREHPLLMQAGGIVTTLEDRKTETRRLRGLDIVNNDPDKWAIQTIVRKDVTVARFVSMNGEINIRCLYGKSGDRLWIREACRAEELESGQDGVRYYADNAFIPIENSAETADRWGKLYWYRAKKREDGLGKKVPSIHMPRWASRILCETVEIRIERVQEISRKDAKAEGFYPGLDGLEHACGRKFGNAQLAFQHLWNSINAKRGYGWDVNPWVWVVKYRRLEP